MLNNNSKSKIIKITLTALIALLAIWLLIIRPYRQSVFEVVKPKTGPAVQAVYATGTVEGSIMLELRPRQTGRLVELLIDEGQVANKGQLLARLEDQEQSANLKELEARLEFAQLNNERQLQLYKNNATSKDAKDRALSELNAVTAALQAAKARLGYQQLHSPNSCTIIKRDGEIGQLLTPEHVVFWLNCGESLRITAEVDEEDIPLVSVGQKVLVRADAFPQQTFETKISSMTPRGDPVARSFRVRIALPENSPLMIGMTVENNIIVRKSEAALLIPISAVSNNHLWTVINNELKSVKVKIGARTDQELEIIEGISQDTLIVKTATQDLKDGQKIRYKPNAVEF